ncbi:MAG: hypothetical protein L0215_03905 [Gemmataceae bacterium]|nr:hypothetical protein [Gemmataceae bacterium]
MHETLIQRLRWRIGGLLALRNALGIAALWAFLWGAVVLVCRVVLEERAGWLWWGLWTLPLAVVPAILWAHSQVPSASRLRAVVDRTSHCGGLLMAAEEHALGPWELKLPPTAHLQLRWQYGKTGGIFLLAMVFLVASLLMPQSLASWASTPALEIGNEVEKLNAQIDVLREEKVLETAQAQFFKEKLDQLKKDTSGLNPAKTLEALDHVREQLTKAAKEAAQASVAQSEHLGKAEGLANGIKQNEGALDPKVEKEAMTELAALVNKAALETKSLDKHLDADLLKQLQGLTLSPEQLKKLAEALKGAKMDLAKMLEKLHAAKLIDAEALKRLAEAGLCDCAGMLKELGGKMSIAAILAKCQGDIPGVGGVNEGPGHAPITWKDKPTSAEGAKFKEETLPPDALAQLKKSMLLGVGKADPKKDGPSASQGGVLNPAAAGGGSANTQTVLPQHRGAVERFFNRPKEK